MPSPRTHLQAPRPRPSATRAPAARAASRPAAPLAEKLTRAAARHPVAAFLRHGKRIAFFRQLHALVKAGTGMPLALDQLARWATPSLAASLHRVRDEVAAGGGFSQALRRHVRELDPASVELVAFAEEAGKLEPVLARLIGHLEKLQKLRWQALAGALWPLYLLGAQVFVGPLFSLSAALAKGAPTSAMGSVYLSGLLTNLAVLALTVGALAAFPLAVAALDADEAWDRFKLRLPAVGRVVRDLYASKLCMALGLAQAAGVEIYRTVEIAALATGSPLVAGRTWRATQALREGGTLADALSRLELLPRTALGSVAVAETSGTLEEAFATLGRESEEAAVRGLQMLIVAVLVLVAGVLLVTIVRELLGTMFGPIHNYYHLTDGL